jgi:hypothetical protein
LQAEAVTASLQLHGFGGAAAKVNGNDLIALL